MTIALDVNDDLAEVADLLVAVTLRRRGSSASTAIAHALRRAVTRAEVAASDGKYTAGDVVWHLPAAELPSAPRLGDRIVDATQVRWTILAVEQATLGTRYRCLARNLALAAGLDATVSIQRAQYVKGASGAAVPRWVDELCGVAARIQPHLGQIEPRDGAIVAERRYRITLADSIELAGNERIVAADGIVYRVLGLERAERIDELPMVLAERERP
jgi:hypothetical protein